MIEASAGKSFDGLAARLTARARKLAEALSRQHKLARRGDPARWRRAVLLWPLFGQG